MVGTSASYFQNMRKNLLSLELGFRLKYLFKIHHIITLLHATFGVDDKWNTYIEVYIVEEARFLLTE